jgi:hypothetical protein
MKQITFEVTDEASPQFVKLLEFLKRCGKIGHSVELVEGVRKDGVFYFDFDGDGLARIDNIKIEEARLKKEKKKKPKGNPYSRDDQRWSEWQWDNQPDGDPNSPEARFWYGQESAQ